MLTVTPKAELANAVTLTVKEANGDKTITVNIVVLIPNYSISAGSPTYHMTLKDAVSSCETGGTVTVLENTTELSEATIDKNLTINTNTKTITSISANCISITSGETIITGNGNLVSSVEYAYTNSVLRVSSNSKLTIENTVTVRSKSRCIDMLDSSTVNLNNCYLIGTDGEHGVGLVHAAGSSTITCNKLIAYTSGRQYCLFLDTTASAIIKGASRLFTEAGYDCIGMGACSVQVLESSYIMHGSGAGANRYSFV